MTLSDFSKPSGRRLRRLMFAPVALVASACLLAGTVTACGPMQPGSTGVASESHRAVDPDFGSVESESVEESIALDALTSNAEMTLNTLSQLAAEGRLELPEADVDGAQLKELLRLAAGRMAALDEKLSDQALDSLAAQSQSGMIDDLFDKIGPDNQFKDSRRLAEGDLHAGDVFVSTTNAAISQVIKVATWGQYSHAALYVGNGQVIDATSRGVTQRSLREFLGEATRVGVLRVKELTNTLRERVVNNARELLGKAYNYDGLAGMALDRMACFLKNPLEAVRCLRSVASIPEPFMGSNAYFCSQLVDTALKRAGVNLFQSNGATPIDFVNLAVRGGESGKLEILGHLK